jgi:hypothetical protein
VISIKPKTRWLTLGLVLQKHVSEIQDGLAEVGMCRMEHFIRSTGDPYSTTIIRIMETEFSYPVDKEKPLNDLLSL